VLLNDTVTTLLAGRMHQAGADFDTYIGFILGTGTNTSYIERNANITKVRGLDAAASQVVTSNQAVSARRPRGQLTRRWMRRRLRPASTSSRR